MLTVEDVTAVPLFSTLPSPELERLARTSADLHLSPGEFAVPKRGERALFAVLSGKIEVVKTIDGVERTLGWRIAGTIFGEDRRYGALSQADRLVPAARGFAYAREWPRKHYATEADSALVGRARRPRM